MDFPNQDSGGNLLMPWLNIKETMFSDYFSYFKNYVPKITVILRYLKIIFEFSKTILITKIRNDLKFDEVILENLKEIDNLDSDLYLEENKNFLKEHKTLQGQSKDVAIFYIYK